MKTREKEIKDMTRLHLMAVELLNNAQDDQRQIDAMLRYNIETAEPRGIDGFTDDEIHAYVKSRDMLMLSHLKVIQEMLSI